MNREELKELMPHREPMLLVDEAYVDEEGNGHGKYTVTGEEFFLKGHFPNHPTVPGVILCEMIAQSSVIMLEDVVKGQLTLFTSMDNVKIKNSVFPGDTFVTQTKITKQKAGFIFIEGKGYVNDKLCISGNFSFRLVPNEYANK